MAKRRAGADVHAHGCRRCRERYEDTCTNDKEDGLCHPCDSGSPPWVLLIENRRPKDCCLRSSRLVKKSSKTENEKARYRLAGASIWFICNVCSRTHPFDPTKTTLKELPAS